MRIFLIILILFLKPQSWTKADDIREFEIDGMSIGDSILVNYNKDEIENKISNLRVYDHKGTYYEAYFLPKNQDNTDVPPPVCSCIFCKSIYFFLYFKYFFYNLYTYYIWKKKKIIT